MLRVTIMSNSSEKPFIYLLKFDLEYSFLFSEYSYVDAEIIYG